MNITVRKAEKKDAPRLVELLGTIAELHHRGRPDIYSAGGAKYTVKDVEKKIGNKDELILVAINDDGYIMGYTMSKIFNTKKDDIMISFKSMYIDDVCVDASFRRNGAGRKLMEATKAHGQAAGCHNVVLNVWAFNENAVEFYKSCGMKVQRMYMEYLLD